MLHRPVVLFPYYPYYYYLDARDYFLVGWDFRGDLDNSDFVLDNVVGADVLVGLDFDLDSGDVGLGNLDFDPDSVDVGLGSLDFGIDGGSLDFGRDNADVDLGG